MIALEFSLAQIDLLKAGTLTQACIIRQHKDMLKTKDKPIDPRFGDIPAITEMWSDSKHPELFVGKWLYATCGGRDWGQILVKGIGGASLQNITTPAAQKCGFERVLDFKLDWDLCHRLKNQKWDANPSVWVIDFIYYTHVFAG